ncbi:hypothetical protein BH09MYX1_BH09MYX1_37790 [soil metagenome]
MAPQRHAFLAEDDADLSELVEMFLGDSAIEVLLALRLAEWVVLLDALRGTIVAAS